MLKEVDSLKDVIVSLTNKVSQLEKTVLADRAVNQQMAAESTRQVSRSHAQTQTDFLEQACTSSPVRRSYADVAQTTTTGKFTTTTSAAGTRSFQIQDIKPGINKTKNSATTVKELKHGTKKYVTKKHDVGRGPQKENKNNGLPKVFILHDSQLKHVNSKRLGMSYAFYSMKTKAPTISDLDKAYKEASCKCTGTPDAIVIHCGINDLKDHSGLSPKEASDNFSKSVENITKNHPSARVIISRIPPSKNKDLEAKRELFNAHVFSSLQSKNNITFVSYDRLHDRLMRDDVHPNPGGTSLMAAQLGRHVEQLLWKTPRKTVRRSPPSQPRPETGFYDWRGRYHQHSADWPGPGYWW
jgi:hypothetical protein